MTLDFVKVLLPATFSFFIGVAMTPLLTHYLYKYKAWKKKSGKPLGYGGGETPIFNELHKNKEVGTPRMGGVIIWASALVTIVGIWLIAKFFPSLTFDKLEFFSRNQTWIPLGTLLIGSCVGFLDDLFEVNGNGSHFAGGLPLSQRLLVVTGVSLFAAWWFYDKLDVVAINIPFYGAWTIGWLFIPLFVVVALIVYAGGVIDGIDGLAGGVFVSIFTAYAGIAFYQQQIDLAAFCATLVGGLLAFLWFNIPPARFYMSETGVMGLTMTLTVVAFMTDTLGSGHGVVVLPVVAFPLIVTVASDVIQIGSKKMFGRKIFKVAPLHHHFEAIGWPGSKVTMRYWVISVICAFIGIIIALAG